MPVHRTGTGPTFGPAVATRPRLPVGAVSINLPKMPHGNVRRRGRDRWQARVYIGGRGGGSVSLGMYPSETAARQVARKVLLKIVSDSLAAAEAAGDAETTGRVSCSRVTPLDVWRATQGLVAGGWDVDGQLAGLLPRCVCLDGRGGYGYRINGGNGCQVPGFSNPLDAYRAAVKARAKLAAERASEKSVEATSVA